MKGNKFVQALCITAISAGITLTASAADVNKIDHRIDAAHAVLHELMGTPDSGIPDSVAARATCVAVIPAFKKGAFVFGGEYGQGVVSCRTHHGWSAPAFIQNRPSARCWRKCARPFLAQQPIKTCRSASWSMH